MHTLKTICLLLLLSLNLLNSYAQHLEMLEGGQPISLRGLSPVSDKIIWVSGSAGKVGKSTDGGAHWEWTTVKGFEKREFRDIEAFDYKTAIVIAIAEPGQILKTTDGGQTWKTVFTDSSKGVFLDAMDFADKQHGIVVGDPLPGSGAIYRLFTNDQGETWTRININASLPQVQQGEAMFASSGSNVRYFRANPDLTKSQLLIVTGGTASSLLSQGPSGKRPLPLLQGKESTGANSIAARSRKQFVIVGGDFSHDADTTGNCILSRDGGMSWIHPIVPPHGYRSCVGYLSAKRLIACGTSGVDISEDGGMRWSLISVDGFHVCSKSKKGNSIFLAGSNGRIAKLVW